MLEHKGFAILAGGLVALIFATPLADQSDDGRTIIQAAFLTLVALAMRLSRVRLHGMLLLSALIGAWFFALYLWQGYGLVTARLTGAALVIAICGCVFVYVGRAVLAAPLVDFNVICGGISCYFLIAIIWAIGFELIDAISPGSFDWRKTGPATLGELMYFSLTCVTTLGFGDFLPVSPFARIFAAFETLTGTIYLSVFVARLVSLYRR